MPPAKRILVVSHEPAERAEMTRQLERAGYVLAVVDDGTLAMNRAITDPPDLIITRAQMPMLDGFKLCQLLRTNPATRHIPFLFMTDKETNPKRLGQFIRPDDDFILKPFRAEELLGRVHNLFYRLDKVQEVSQEADRSVAGTLTEIALVDLLQIFKMNRKNGVLTLRMDNQTGQIYIRDGAVVNARLGKVSGEKAIYRLVAWDHGTFEFKPSIVDVELRIQQSTENLVMEGLRQLDELNRMGDKVAPRRATIRLKKTFRGPVAKLKPVTRDVLHLLEYFHRVEEVLDNSTFSDLEVFGTIQALLAHDVIELTSEGDAGIAAPREPFLSLEEALKIGYYLGVGRGEANQRWMGKILFFAQRREFLERFLELAEGFPEFSREPLLLPGEAGDGFSVGVKAALSLMDNMTLLFHHLPPAEGCEPLWRAFHHRAIGALLIGDGDAPVAMAPVVDFLERYGIPYRGVVAGEHRGEGSGPGREATAKNWLRLDPAAGDFLQRALRGLFDAILGS